MNVDTGQVRQCLKSFDFKRLFIQELNWSHCTNRPLDLEIDGDIARISPFAELGGVVVYQVELINSGGVPSAMVRRQIENKIKQLTHEHVIIFVDSEKSKSVWQWIRRGTGFQTATREHPYYRNQPGDSLMAKLDGIAFDISELDTDGGGNVKVIKVVERLRKAFDVEKVTKRFYEEFKKEHDMFKKFLKGIEGQDDQAWYVSVMLNRMMFIYFIQKKGFLDGDTNYLANKLKESKLHGADQFYKKFITRLFFEGFAKEETDRTPEAKNLLGHVPYLNGGIFQKHKLEEENPNIVIPDIAFEKIITFFDRYNWHLDYRPLKADNEINPDVLGYIFEKYINQKQMGAYYTKEDITDYICKNTIIPFLFDKLENMRYDELHPFPMKDVEPYIYDAVKQKDYLPTESEREYQARQKRYQQIKDDFAAGKIANINYLITYNLDIRKFTEDWVASIHDPVTLRAFYFHCLTKVTILDPAVGSGAFLFAALNMLELLYGICLDKMEELGGPKYLDFADELKRISQHPNRQYFILKSIIVNNLFGVDIMEEAVEICKLRLFLKLVAQVDDVNKIEPLPDIDFNIRAGNSLVGYANQDDIKKAKTTQLDISGVMKGIEQRIEDIDRTLKIFRNLQTKVGISGSELAKAKTEVNRGLADIQNELNKDLSAGTHDSQRFVKTHMPFHWFVEFYRIISDGGFDVIIGNPPYVNTSKVEYTIDSTKYTCNKCKDLFALVVERALMLVRLGGRVGVIIPLSATSTDVMEPLKKTISDHSTNIWASYYSASDQPSSLFSGVRHRLLILLSKSGKPKTGNIYSTDFIKWFSEERQHLFQSFIQYQDTTHFPHFCKISTSHESSMLTKLLPFKSLSYFVTPRGFPVYYHNAPVHWGKVFDFIPNYLVDGVQSRSTHLKEIHLANEKDAAITICALNSSLFYWFNWQFSNCRDLSPKDILRLPIGLDVMNEEIKQSLVVLKKQLMADFKAHSRPYRRVSKGITTEFDSFYPMFSKPIINEIDHTLAKHYGFSAIEADFIINYDLKYRMGKNISEEEEY